MWIEYRGIRIVNHHRPLSAYLKALLGAGLVLTHFDEPAPSAEAPASRARRVRSCAVVPGHGVAETGKQMGTAFTKEPDDEGGKEDQVADESAPGQVAGVKNYITPSGLQRLKDERRFLLTRERPAVTQVVAWAASNGDRSENADYQYGKRRLREIDRRIRFLTKRIDAAEVVDPEAPRGGRAATQVFFGATVRYANAAGTERVVSVVGVDEVDLERNYISWLSPLARALMKSGAGDRVVLHAPGGRSNWRSSRCVISASPWNPSANHREPRPCRKAHRGDRRYRRRQRRPRAHG